MVLRANIGGSLLPNCLPPFSSVASIKPFPFSKHCTIHLLCAWKTKWRDTEIKHLRVISLSRTYTGVAQKPDAALFNASRNLFWDLRIHGDVPFLRTDDADKNRRRFPAQVDSLIITDGITWSSIQGPTMCEELDDRRCQFSGNFSAYRIYGYSNTFHAHNSDLLLCISCKVLVPPWIYPQSRRSNTHLPCKYDWAVKACDQWDSTGFNLYCVHALSHNAVLKHLTF